MKNKIQLKNKKYLFLFVLVMILNVVLAGILLRSSMGQTKTDFSSQKPVKVEVVEQKDSPLRITVVDVDNSGAIHQEIICSLQNVSGKSMRGYVLLADGQKSNKGGKIITSFFAAKLFPANGSEVDSVPIERMNITEDETFLLSIDYVEFTDGSSWGTDSAGKSKEIAGERAGIRAALDHLKNLLKSQNANDIANYLKQDIVDFPVTAPDVNKPDEWQRGFRLGYKTVISTLQRLPDQKIENFSKKLDEIEKIAN